MKKVLKHQCNFLNIFFNVYSKCNKKKINLDHYLKNSFVLFILKLLNVANRNEKKKIKAFLNDYHRYILVKAPYSLI